MKHKLHVGVFCHINPQQTGVSSWVKDTLPRPNPHDHSGGSKQASHTFC
jgi:hypothetical protein